MHDDDLVEPGDTEREAAVRREVRPWMREHAGRFGPARDLERMNDRPELAEQARAWQAELDEGGWGAPMWPVAWGGRGYGPDQQRIFRQEMLRYAVPIGPYMVAHDMVAPTLLQHGTDAQRERFLAPMRHGDHVWCQLFSEPDAGSDLASLRTRAERDGDEWVVHGQKVWTSGAKTSDWGILLARTDPSTSRHEGITYFLVDMRTPGIDVRPIVQANRAAHFNEVHLDGVRLPADAVVGEVGEGWKVARTTLTAERGAIGSVDMSGRWWRIVEAAQARGATADPVVRQALVDAYVRLGVLRMTSDRVLNAVRAGGAPGPEASVLKLGISKLFGQLGELAMQAGGAAAMLEGEGPDGYGYLQDVFLSQWSSRIGGGTEQMQRNMIGERSLGLPRDPR